MFPVHDTTFITVTDTLTLILYDTIAVTDTVTDTLWLHDTIYLPQYIHDTVYITQEGIDGMEVINAKVYSNQGQIVVEGADGNRVTLFDINGRALATKQDEFSQLRFEAPVSGTYMIKIGNYPARKVVVIK